MRSDDGDSAAPSPVTASDGEHRDDAAGSMDDTAEVPTPLLQSHIDSGRIAAQPTPTSDGGVAVAKVCPQCGSEYETVDRFCPEDGSPLRPNRRRSTRRPRHRRSLPRARPARRGRHGPRLSRRAREDESPVRDQGHESVAGQRHRVAPALRPRGVERGADSSSERRGRVRLRRDRTRSSIS